jgi:hypothetical protein
VTTVAGEKAVAEKPRAPLIKEIETICTYVRAARHSRPSQPSHARPAHLGPARLAQRPAHTSRRPAAGGLVAMERAARASGACAGARRQRPHHHARRAANGHLPRARRRIHRRPEPRRARRLTPRACAEWTARRARCAPRALPRHMGYAATSSTWQPHTHSSWSGERACPVVRLDQVVADSPRFTARGRCASMTSSTSAWLKLLRERACDGSCCTRSQRDREKRNSKRARCTGHTRGQTDTHSSRHEADASPSFPHGAPPYDIMDITHRFMGLSLCPSPVEGHGMIDPHTRDGNGRTPPGNGCGAGAALYVSHDICPFDRMLTGLNPRMRMAHTAHSGQRTPHRPGAGGRRAAKPFSRFRCTLRLGLVCAGRACPCAVGGAGAGERGCLRFCALSCVTRARATYPYTAEQSERGPATRVPARLSRTTHISTIHLGGGSALPAPPRRPSASPDSTCAAPSHRPSTHGPHITSPRHGRTETARRRAPLT